MACSPENETRSIALALADAADLARDVVALSSAAEEPFSPAENVNDVSRHLCTVSRGIAPVGEGGFEPPTACPQSRSATTAPLPVGTPLLHPEYLGIYRRWRRNKSGWSLLPPSYSAQEDA